MAALPFDETDSGTNGATREEPFEPHSCISSGATVWYRFTPDHDMRLEVTTQGSSYDTVLAVYEGSDLANLSLIACNDNSSESGTSSVSFGIQAGLSVSIQVGAYAFVAGDALTQVGDLAFSMKDAGLPTKFSPPANDDIADATEIGSFPYQDYQYLGGATMEQNEPQDCASPGPLYAQSTVWYRYTATRDGVLHVGSFMDWAASYLGVFRQTQTGPSLITCASSYEDYGDQWSEQFAVQAGTAYLFQLIADRSYGYDYTTTFSGSALPEADLGVRSVSVRPMPGLVTGDSRAIRVGVGLEGLAFATGDWTVEACPMEPVDSPARCSVIDQGTVDVGPDDRGKSSFDVYWTPVGCVGDVIVRATIKATDVYDGVPANDTSETTTSVIAPGGGVGVGACSVPYRL